MMSWSTRVSLIGLLAVLTGCPVAPPPATPASAESGKIAIPQEATANLYTPDNQKPSLPATTRPYDPTVVVVVGDVSVGRSELDDALRQSFGLRIAFDLALRDLAKDLLLKRGHMLIDPADVERERKITVDKITDSAVGQQREDLFTQFLNQQNTTKAEFEIKVIQTNAYLRKLIEPQVVGRVPEPVLRAGFDQMYGGKRRIADILLPDLNAVQDARGRLQQGVSFKDVAKLTSMDPYTRDRGGVWEPFSANNKRIPSVIVTTAFGMEVGQISDPLAVDGQYHMIQLLEIVAPATVKYDDVKGHITPLIEEQLVQTQIKVYREQLGRNLQETVQLADPVLLAEWNQSKAKPKTVDKNDLDHRMRDGQPLGPTTAPVANVGP